MHQARALLALDSQNASHFARGLCMALGVMKKYIHWPSLFIGLSIASLGGWLLQHFTSLGWWPAFGIAVGALIVNGVVATIEDDRPGGFNNPTGSEGDKNAR